MAELVWLTCVTTWAIIRMTAKIIRYTVAVLVVIVVLLAELVNHGVRKVLKRT